MWRCFCQPCHGWKVLEWLGCDALTHHDTTGAALGSESILLSFEQDPGDTAALGVATTPRGSISLFKVCIWNMKSTSHLNIARTAWHAQKQQFQEGQHDNQGLQTGPMSRIELKRSNAFDWWKKWSQVVAWRFSYSGVLDPPVLTHEFSPSITQRTPPKSSCATKSLWSETNVHDCLITGSLWGPNGISI